ncbi:MAG: Plug domain-containing protein [Lewinellaceae bacterium]|nr:Plug domain-containing protein [Lewinellaceae bacterium]
MKHLFSCIFLLFLPWVLTAQVTTAPDANNEAKDSLSEIVISAQRSPGEAFKSPEIVRLLDKKTMRRALARTLPEALLETTGVWVQKTNHGGGSPFLRGLTGNQTLLLMDGIRLNNATFRYGPNQYFEYHRPFQHRQDGSAVRQRVGSIWQ